MFDSSPKNRRVVVARREVTLGALAATLVGTAAGAAVVPVKPRTGPGRVHLAAAQGGEGAGGEGGAVVLDPDVGLLRDLELIEGHMRAGMALYRQGDLAAAKSHVGHSIKGRYDTVAGPLKAKGYGRLQAEMETLAEVAEAATDKAGVEASFNAVIATLGEVRSGMSGKDRLAALVALMQVAGDEYAIAVEGGTLSDLHDYQSSWGFLQVVVAEAEAMAQSDDAGVAKAAGKIAGYLEKTQAAYGDLQGQGAYEMDPSLIYGAAARMELAVAGVK